jgi:hypothetical protein
MGEFWQGLGKKNRKQYEESSIMKDFIVNLLKDRRLIYFLLIFMIGLFIGAVCFADSIVSDPQASNIGNSYEIWQAAKGQPDIQVLATGKLIATKPFEADGSIKYNVDSLPAGTYDWYFRAIGFGYIYGAANTPGGSAVTSVFVPFDFTKRTSLSTTITGMKLIQ